MQIHVILQHLVSKTATITCVLVLNNNLIYFKSLYHLSFYVQNTYYSHLNKIWSNICNCVKKYYLNERLLAQ